NYIKKNDMDPRLSLTLLSWITHRITAQRAYVNPTRRVHNVPSVSQMT
ncbi:10447_t:CDS:1, partial [Gigaspora rosea]